MQSTAAESTAASPAVRAQRKLQPRFSTPCDDMAEESVLFWLNTLHGHAETEFLSGVRRFVSLFGHGQHGGYGTGCSATDISRRCERAIFNIFERKLGLRVKLPAIVSCEKDPRKRQFLLLQHDVPLVISKLSELASPSKVCNVRNGQLELPGQLLHLLVGIPCISRTSLSSKCAQNMNCVQEGRSATGCAFEEVLEIVQSHWPTIVALECVRNLDQKKSGKQSDAQWICEQMRSQGYWSFYQVMDNADEGMIDAARSRLWWLSARGLRGSHLSVRRKCFGRQGPQLPIQSV